MAELTDYWRERRDGDRHAGRFACRFLAEGRAVRGLVRNASVRGLFLESEAAPTPGTTVRISVVDDAGRVLEAAGIIVRRVLNSGDRKIHGLGLVLHAASRDFLRWVAGACRTRSPRRLSESDRYRYRVVAKSQSGRQLRTLSVSGRDAGDARALANEHLGSVWSLLEVRKEH